MVYNFKWNDISYINYTCKDVYCFGLAKSGDFHGYGGALALKMSQDEKWQERLLLRGLAFS